MTSLTESPIPPWYRQGWPWFLISIPLVSVLLGFLMLYLALGSNNALVVDDYYTEGKTINQRIERDRQAALLGLSATFEQRAGALIVDLRSRLDDAGGALANAAGSTATGNDQPAFSLPETLELRWVHVTQADHDGTARLRHVGGGRYVAAGAHLPPDGNWHLHLQPLERARWRLVSERVDLARASIPILQARAFPDLDRPVNP